ncbi:hypothetical protein [Thiolapillus sp.]|uniref:hypothetical protein n=1 Tax=Thiolapillus sp. TaxID=2017437 RepID=UPI003AF5D21A
MTRTAVAPIGCQRPSRFWGLGCPKIYHEVEDTLGIQQNGDCLMAAKNLRSKNADLPFAPYKGALMPAF